MTMAAADSSLDLLLGALRAAAEASRLRLLAICAQGEWTVSELTQVMAQSQPRISRHLKLLAEAGLLERFREGSWVFYRRAQHGAGARLARSLGRLLPEDDAALLLDRRRLADVQEARRKAAEDVYDRHPDGRDIERDIAVDGAEVEAALSRLFEDQRPESLLDVGTGTGRILQVLAPHVGFGLGIDRSHDMLRVARANLDRRLARNCQVRHGDMYHLPLPEASFSAVTLHQVLHFADDPSAVLAEARRVLKPGGRLVVVDLAQHEAEWLRTQRAHRRLGFADSEIAGWLEELGLVQEPSIRLAGEALTVTIWCARVPSAVGAEAIEARNTLEAEDTIEARKASAA
jgi:ArsR family transcriptional regulator